MAGYILSPEARGDLQGIWEFIALDNPDAATRIVNELLAAFEHLVEWPGSGHTRPDLTTKRCSLLARSLLSGDLPRDRSFGDYHHPSWGTGYSFILG